MLIGISLTYCYVNNNAENQWIFFSQFCITCIVQGRWNGAFISNISFYLNEILIVTLKCHYRNSIAIVSPLSQYYCNGVSTIAIVKMGAIVTPT